MDLVQVRAVYYAVNTLIPSNLLSEYDLILTRESSGLLQSVLTSKDIDRLKQVSFEADLNTKISNIMVGNAPELRWPQYEIMLLDFSFFGQSFGNDYTSGTEWNMREGNGVTQDMAEEADHLWRISEQLLSEHNAARGVALQTVQWVAVFASHFSAPDENGEREGIYEFCGRLDLDTLTVVDVPKGIKL